MSVSAAEQLEILRRGVDSITPEADFVRKLDHSVAQGVPLRVKYGIDPTGIDVHLGHTVPLRKLRQFQDLGHTAVIIIGNYTALVGDPSGRDEARVALTEEQVNANARDYLTQVGKIIDLSRAEVHHNGDWFSKWSFLDVLNLTRRMTLGQISAREDFSKRISEKKPVYLHECLYPLMQGWDSVEIKSDIELGGTEQLFSLLLARHLQLSEGQPGQVAITMPILVGTDGVRKMGKSLNNYIAVGQSAYEQFGKVMSLPDGPMRQYFTLLTNIPLEMIDNWLLAPDKNPRDAKEYLGKCIVEQYHGKEAAEDAVENFRRRAKGIAPEFIPEVVVLVSPKETGPEWSHTLHMLIGAHCGFEGINSSSDIRRMIEGGGVKIGLNKISIRDPKEQFTISEDGRVVRFSSDLELDDLIIRYGKRQIVRVKFVVQPKGGEWGDEGAIESSDPPSEG